ncbi:hypothetical protein [Streptomyces sp. NPDC056690]|uniref:hypothetical protein n=1 Tax=unclassified Streptomyces TaxID=2593676 RepID=UPI00363A85B7
MIARIADRLRGLVDLLARFGPGSRVLLLRLVARFGWKVTGVVLAAALYTAPRYRQWIVWVLLGWCAAAWSHAPSGEPAEDHVEDADAPGEEGSAGPDPADVADVVRDVVGAGRGALLTGLCGPLGAADTQAVRECLDAAGIPVRPGGCARPAGTGPAFTAPICPPLTPLRPTHRLVLLPQVRTPTPPTADGWRSERG